MLGNPSLHFGKSPGNEQLGAVGLLGLPTGAGAGKRPVRPALVSVADGNLGFKHVEQVPKFARADLGMAGNLALPVRPGWALGAMPAALAV